MNKKLILLIFCISLVQCSHSKRTLNNKVLIDINVIEELDSIEIGRFDETCYLANIEIKNNTDSTFKFWTMTCAWQVNWISNHNFLRLSQEECDRNFPVMEKINSRDSLIYKGIICVENDVENIKEKNFRLGLILIRETDLAKSNDFLDTLSSRTKSSKFIIWSEPFRIDK